MAEQQNKYPIKKMLVYPSGNPRLLTLGTNINIQNVGYLFLAEGEFLYGRVEQCNNYQKVNLDYAWLRWGFDKHKNEFRYNRPDLGPRNSTLFKVMFTRCDSY